MGKISIEESLESLEEILEKMEDGEVPLEEAFKLYNDGLKMVKTCSSQLEKIEKQMIVLQENSEGTAE